MAGLSSVSVRIADAQTVSSGVDLHGGVPSGIQIPAGFEGTALTLQASIDGSTYQAVYDDGGTQVSFTVAAGRFVSFRDTIYQALKGIRYLKLVAGTAQTGAIDLTIALRF